MSWYGAEMNKRDYETGVLIKDLSVVKQSKSWIVYESGGKHYIEYVYSDNYDPSSGLGHVDPFKIGEIKTLVN